MEMNEMNETNHLPINWQSQCRYLTNRCNVLLTKGLWTDCKFLVGTGAEQRTFEAHKLILCMGSPEFERLLYGQYPHDCQQPICLPEVSPDIFYKMLEFFYTNKVSITSFNQAIEMFQLAHRYMIQPLTHECEQFLTCNLNTTNAFRVYDLATFYERTSIMKLAMKIIRSNLQRMIYQPVLMNVHYKTILDILSENELRINSEIELFNLLIKYAKANNMLPLEESDLRCDDDDDAPSEIDTLTAATGGSNPPSVEESDGDADADIVINIDAALLAESEHIRNILNSINQLTGFNEQSTEYQQRRLYHNELLRKGLKKLRFLTMTPEEFQAGPGSSQLLTHHEVLCIMQNLITPFVDNTYPEGFCRKRLKRDKHRPLPRRRRGENQCSNVTDVNECGDF